MQLDAKSLRAKLLSGLIALFQKDYKAAELYFESAVLQSPKDSGASNNLALALIEQKDEAKRDRALQYAEANVQQYPKWAEGYSTYGWVLYKLGRLDEAEKALQPVDLRFRRLGRPGDRVLPGPHLGRSSASATTIPSG